MAPIFEMPRHDNGHGHDHDPDHSEGYYASAVSSLLSHQATDPAWIRASAARRTRTVADMREYMRRIGISYRNVGRCGGEGGEDGGAGTSTPSGGGNATTHVGTHPAFQSIVHVTGTKGKGSTCSMVESILRRSHGRRTGLFTSPHLVNVTERIRLDGRPVSFGEFADAYFEVRRRLELGARGGGGGEDGTEEEGGDFDGDVGTLPPPLPVLPGYFRMLTLVALFIFAHHRFDDDNDDGAGAEGVDVTILEVGMGGRYDATNAFERSDVCAVTLIDLDHTRVLGDTLEKIAWEKGGIVKGPTTPNGDLAASPSAAAAGVSDFVTTDQNTPGVIGVLRGCADEVGATLEVVTCGKRVDPSWSIGLAGKHQYANAEVAVAVCEAWGRKQAAATAAVGTTLATPGAGDLCSVREALGDAFWPGRCQVIHPPEFHGLVSLFCDGAHTERSLSACLGWYLESSRTDEKTYDCREAPDGAENIRTTAMESECAMTTQEQAQSRDSSHREKAKRALLFNCSHERNPVPLLQRILSESRGDGGEQGTAFDEVHFCAAESERPSAISKASAKNLLAEAGVFSESLYARHANGVQPRVEHSSSGAGAATWQETLASIWIYLESRMSSVGEMRNASGAAAVSCGESVQEAIAKIGGSAVRKGEGVNVLVTGSLYIVGSALEAGGWIEESAGGHLEFAELKCNCMV